VAAERLGLPYATVVVIAAGTFVRPGLIAGNLSRLRAEHGLPPDPELSMLDRHLVLCPVPAGYRDPSVPLPATAVLFRPDPVGAPVGASVGATDPAPGQPPAWLRRRDGGPAVYFTLGTVFNMESGDLFSRVLAGLRDLDASLVVTVGPYLDPADLGPQPPNVHIGQFIPQDVILPHVDVVVSHAGSGSVLGALSHGRPMVLIPMGADQPSNASRCVDLGVARVLDAVAATPQDAREAVRGVLADPGYRRAAERIRDEFAAMPGPAYAVAALERLVTARPAAR
jgi:UDP:flavonoid glycosyltransferase YjiC (YdhE family)